MAGVNCRFAEVTENDILRMQDITIPYDTKKAMKLWNMKVFRDKQCFDTQFANIIVPCLLSWSPNSADISLPEQQLSFHGSISKSHPSQLNSTPIEQNVFIQENLNVAISLKNDCDFQHSQQQAHGMISGGNFANCSFTFSFK